jgi:uncharacterized repeat protein (TIGR01451 family)
VNLDEHDYTVKFHLDDTAYIVPETHKNFTFPSFSTTESLDFPVQLRDGVADINISAISLTNPAPGSSTTYQVVLVNQGSQMVPSGIVRFIKDSKTDFISALPAPAIAAGDTITWNYTNLAVTDTLKFLLTLKIENQPPLDPNDTLLFDITSPLSNDSDTTDNAILMKQVVGANHENAKTETHGGTINAAHSDLGEYLNYVIRFENRTTDTVTDLLITDTIDNTLDFTSFEMIGASHTHRMNLNDRTVNWNFYGIKLTPIAVNPQASAGYVAFRIRVQKNLPVNTVITNTATIWFDDLVTVKTNTSTTILTDSHKEEDVIRSGQLSFRIIPNPTAGPVNFQVNSSIHGDAYVKLFNSIGQLLFIKKLGPVTAAQTQTFPLQLTGLAGGLYFVVVNVNEAQSVRQLMIR